MSIAQLSLWGIVLAVGERVRLKEFVRERIGTDAPKEFCVIRISTSPRGCSLVNQQSKKEVASGSSDC